MITAIRHRAGLFTSAEAQTRETPINVAARLMNIVYLSTDGPEWVAFIEGLMDAGLRPELIDSSCCAHGFVIRRRI